MSRSNPASILGQPTLIGNLLASSRLYRWGLFTVITVGFWFINKNQWEIDIQTILGLAIMALASRPALLWAKQSRTWFPAFEIGMLTCIPFYAIPLLAHHRELRFYPESVIIKASGLVIIYILVGSFCFSSWKRRPHLSRLMTLPLVPPGIYKYIPIGILLSNIHIYITTFTQAIPGELSRALGALFFGIGTLSIFISSRIWGLGLMSPWQKTFLLLNICFQVILLFYSLYLIWGISIVALAIISYSMSRRSLPWLPLVIFLPIISLLHLGKGEMRQKYWVDNARGGRAEQIEINQLPLYFAEWIGYGLQAERVAKDTHVKQDTIFDRASLIHMLCLSVDRVPREQPYLGGESYIDIPALLVPRILWKNKPIALISNQRLSLYFDLVSPDNPSTVSIAFGMLAEAYINFGYIGVITLAALLGFGLNRLAHASTQAPQFSFIGILSILLTAWSLQVEQVAVTWLSSLFQAMVICIGVPMAFHIFSSKADPSKTRSSA
ncbi:hypothetical protein [Cephaloticoccus primus]|uniref:hypothetical protein n=1 Tax=Cephaloticoccus primus TaxID=1548207 RepID=UPI0012E73E6A|nr:hypothetical protein [Cephaloticoccus primus]